MAIDNLGDGSPAPVPARESDKTAQMRRVLFALLQQLDERGEVQLGSDQARRSFAKRIYATRRLRDRFFPESMFCEPAWDMLLLLYNVRAPDEQLSVSAVCAASGAPYSTSLRWLKLLEEAHLIARLRHPSDRRITWLQLTGSGRNRLDRYFDEALKSYFGSQVRD